MSQKGGKLYLLTNIDDQIGCMDGRMDRMIDGINGWKERWMGQMDGRKDG